MVDAKNSHSNAKRGPSHMNDGSTPRPCVRRWTHPQQIPIPRQNSSKDIPIQAPDLTQHVNCTPSSFSSAAFSLAARVNYCPENPYESVKRPRRPGRSPSGCRSPPSLRTPRLRERRADRNSGDRQPLSQSETSPISAPPPDRAAMGGGGGGERCELAQIRKHC